MRRLCLCSGVHGNAACLELLEQAVAHRRPEAVLFAGGILNPDRHCAARLTPWSLSTADLEFAGHFFATLGRLGVFCAVIPGPDVGSLDDFFRLGLQAELVYPHVHVAHASLIEEGHVALCGLGGTLAESPLLGVESYSRPAIHYFLRPLLRSHAPRKILLLSAPPPGPLGGREGQELVADLIDSYHPNLCVVGGMSTQRGSQLMGRTLVVNPGRLADGWTAWLDWGEPARDRLEFVNLTKDVSRCYTAREDNGTPVVSGKPHLIPEGPAAWASHHTPVVTGASRCSTSP